MTKIDLKDRKILYELDLNCRQSNAQIGKKVGLKRDIVAYRIKRMQDEGVIKNFWTAINTFKLGYNVFRIYINFQYVNSDVKKKIIQHFVNYRNAWAVISVKAEIDFDVIVWVRDVYEFYQFWSKTLDKFEDYFAKYTLSLYIETFNYKSTYLLDETYDKDRLAYITTCCGKTFEIDDLDYQILDEIAINARVPLIELAEKFKCSAQSINYRIKNLIKNEIIKAFRVDVNYQKLGFHKYRLELYLTDHKQRKVIWNYIKSKNFCDTLNVAVGWCDLEFEIIAENVEKLSEIMDEISSKFPKAIKKQNFWIFDEYHKERWLPEH